MTNVVKSAYVRMVQTGDHATFTLEALTQSAARQMLWNNLDRNRTVQACVAGAIHLAHTASSQRREDFVRPKFCACVEHDYQSLISKVWLHLWALQQGPASVNPPRGRRCGGLRGGCGFRFPRLQERS